MTPENILKHEGHLLSRLQREFYFENGYVALEGLIPREWIDAVQTASNERIDASREETKSGDEFDLGPNHSSDIPHVRRIKRPVDHHPIFRKFAVESPLVDIAADLVGPDVKFHSCKINYKYPGGGEIVKWHQDICFWPHTNYSPVTLGFYLDGCEEAQGPLTVIPGSHKGDLFRHYDEDGNWVGTVSDKDMSMQDMDSMAGPTGPEGTVLALNCRTLHSSKANQTNKVRPILLYVYTSADAFAWTYHPTLTAISGDIVRGEQAAYPHMDPRPCPVPPDWSRIGYGSIFTSQEKGDAGGIMG
tara:strand:+ start:2061 stop:2966 length:906 start_codon:yes stop_codon:yes gene_type:complete